MTTKTTVATETEAAAAAIERITHGVKCIVRSSFKVIVFHSCLCQAKLRENVLMCIHGRFAYTHMPYIYGCISIVIANFLTWYCK